MPVFALAGWLVQGLWSAPTYWSHVLPTAALVVDHHGSGTARHTVAWGTKRRGLWGSSKGGSQWV